MPDLSSAVLAQDDDLRPAPLRTTCPSCGGGGCTPFYEVRKVPTNSCLLVGSRAEALAFPSGDITLAHCGRCGFIFNASFVADRTIYSDAYEETQAFSTTFNAFNRRLAEDLIERHDLHGKRVAEIGCGKGEFLSLLCDLGGNQGLGYDPSFHPERLQAADPGRIRVLREFFTDDTPAPDADLVCCKMTLEHIAEVGPFIRMVRDKLQGRERTVVFFQIPDAARILAEGAFWDVYYEHCSYFTVRSLESLFTRSGFAVDRIWTDYGDQYLMIEAHPAERARRPPPSVPASGSIAGDRVNAFADTAGAARRHWLELIRDRHSRGLRVVLWGSGSKAVAFLTTLGLREEIQRVVDINPYRHDRFLPITGQRIVPPRFLKHDRPDVVIVMNPIYRDEVARELASQGVSAELLVL